MIVFWAIAPCCCLRDACITPALMSKPRTAASVTRDALNVSVYRDQLSGARCRFAAGTLARRVTTSLREIEQSVLEDTGAAAQRSPQPREPAARCCRGLAVPASGVCISRLPRRRLLTPEQAVSATRGMARRAADCGNGRAARGTAGKEPRIRRVGDARACPSDARPLRRGEPGLRQCRRGAQRTMRSPGGVTQTRLRWRRDIGSKANREADRESPRHRCDNVKALALAGTVAFGRKTTAPHSCIGSASFAFARPNPSSHSRCVRASKRPRRSRALPALRHNPRRLRLTRWHAAPAAAARAHRSAGSKARARARGESRADRYAFILRAPGSAAHAGRDSESAGERSALSIHARRSRSMFSGAKLSDQRSGHCRRADIQSGSAAVQPGEFRLQRARRAGRAACKS